MPKPPPIPFSRKKALQLGLALNPKLALIQAKIDAAHHSILVAKSNFLPQLSLELSAQQDRNVKGVSGKVKDVRGMVVLKYNLFAGGEDVATLDKARQKRQAAIYDFNDIRAQVQEKINWAWDKYENGKINLQTLKNYVKSSEVVLKDYKLQFDLGRNSLLNVLDMENELYKANSKLIAAKYELIGSHYELLAAMGRLVANLADSNS